VAPEGRFEAEYVSASPLASVADKVKVRVWLSLTILLPIAARIGAVLIFTLPLTTFNGIATPSGLLIMTLERLIKEVPVEPTAVAFMIINEPEFETLLGPRMTPKIFTTVPGELLIIPLLKNVWAPFCLKRFPSDILLTLIMELLKARFNCAPAIAVLIGSMDTIKSKVSPGYTVLFII
jgi:hypothetical protein